MPTDGFTPRLDLFARISPTKINTDSGVPPMRFTRVEKPETNDFKAVMSGLVENLNTSVNAPDQLMKDMMMDKAEIHDVMTAMSIAEVNMSIATQVTTKIVQTYEKIMQIQV